MCTKDFLKQVLKDEKKLLKMSDVKFVNVPSFDEISVRALYDRVVSNPDIAIYFPSKFPKGMQCSREYMFNVWNTMEPEQVKAVINHANSQRYSVKNDKVREDTILITEEWRDQIEQMPFVSKQRGRMSDLLKQKSKVQAIHKERVKYEVYKFEKRPRITTGQSQSSLTQT